MFHTIVIAPFILTAASVAAPAQLPSAAEQTSCQFYRYARVKALVVEVEHLSAENLRKVAKNLVDGANYKGAGLREILVDDDGMRGSFLVIGKDKERVTRITLRALPGRSARFLAVIGSWSARLDGCLSGQLDQEASSIEHEHAFEGGVESISYEWNPPLQ